VVTTTTVVVVVTSLFWHLFSSGGLQIFCRRRLETPLGVVLLPTPTATGYVLVFLVRRRLGGGGSSHRSDAVDLGSTVSDLGVVS
ncbi:hypothetical protein A2U01_0069069, partial [Trifolium medium]|nr:hypothetical protein [Trifolium medium]